VKQGEPAFALRAAGKTIPLRAPVSGTVVAVNEAAARAPAALHDDPYGAGWLFRVEPRRLSKNLKSLISGEKARLFLAESAENLYRAFHPGARSWRRTAASRSTASPATRPGALGEPRPVELPRPLGKGAPP